MTAAGELDVGQALEALGRFWAALTGDDDLALLRVTSRELQERIGTGLGMCARLRELNGIDPEEIRRRGTWSTAYILPPLTLLPAIGFVCPDDGGHTVPMIVPAGTPLLVWRPVMVLERDGVWRFTGMAAQPGWPDGTREVDVPGLPPKPVS